MVDLDNREVISRLDKSNLSGSILVLDSQCQQAAADVAQLAIPADYKNCDQIVVVGMGGSGLATRIITALYSDQLTVPVALVSGYDLPAWVNSNTVVLLSSYSGDTEEVLAAAEKVGQGKPAVICGGGKLAEIARKNGWPGYIFESKFNPSGQPRMGLGYAIMGAILLFEKLGVLDFDQQDLDQIVEVIGQFNLDSKIEVPTNDNPAKQLALKLASKIPILVGAQHLAGNTHTLANQINENAKTFATAFDIPEVNHHLLEALAQPKTNKNDLFFVLVNSNLYLPRIQKRFEITKKVIEAAGIEVYVYGAATATKLEQSFEVLTFGSWLSFYLAIASDIDPSPIPVVDFFKKEMAKAD